MAASSARPTITTEDIRRLRFVQSADLSPDGRRAVCALQFVDAEANADRIQLLLVDVETGATTPLTAGTSKDLNPVWSPDGTRIAFVSDRTGVPQVFVIAPDGGEARQVTRLPLGVAGTVDWSPDSAMLAFPALAATARRDPTVPYRVTRRYYRFDEIGHVDDALLDIHVAPADGGDVRRLTDDACANTLPHWTADGTAIVYLAGFDPDATALTNQVRVVDLAGHVRDVAHPAGMAASLGVGPDGRVAFIQGTSPERRPGSHAELFAADLATMGAEPRSSTFELGLGGRLQPDSAASPDPIVLGINAGAAITTVQVGGGVGLYAFALDGPERWREVAGGDRSIALLAQRGTRALVLVSSESEPGDLAVVDVEGGDERRLTRLNEAVLAERTLPTVDTLAFRGTDGDPVQGWFLRPPAGEAPYPTILYIHGGPHGAFGHGWHSDMQQLCGAGFGVLVVNHRGSTGYGEPFATSLAGRWGDADYHDLMAGVDHAVEVGLADPDRLGVCGLSGGGNLTCWIVGQTNRFRAAVPENPVTNFVSFYGVSDIGPWFISGETGGQPWERLQQYLRQSPITHAHRCRTPTLLVQGEADLRCPVEQSEQFYAVLRANGCVAEMLRLPGAAHAGAIRGPLAARMAQDDALLDWMHRYVLEAAPAPAKEAAVTS